MKTLIFLLALAFAAPAAVRAADDDKTPIVAPTTKTAPVPAARRPMVLVPLYVSFAGLQGYDGYTTVHGISAGAHESNAVVGGLASKPAAFWAIKAGSTALTFAVAEQLWRNHHRREAVAAMIISNGLMAYVAANNASTLRTTR
jgi:hypothetical protein